MLEGASTWAPVYVPCSTNDRGPVSVALSILIIGFVIYLSLTPAGR